MSTTRYAQVGMGARGEMYYQSLIDQFGDVSTVVAFCDLNQGRTDLAKAWTQSRGVAARTYSVEQFDRMVHETKPDVVIVTTKDSDHADYICRSLDLGCDVICEKPMTIDAASCQRIIDAQRRTGKQIIVTFNARYLPYAAQVKDLLMSGAIGEVLSVDFHWMLDVRHGADYFRRWHRQKENSGGLLVHKATHHFDLANWWLSSVPKSVFAQGQRRFYTPHTADRFGLSQRGERCLDCAEADNCRFHLDLRSSNNLQQLYVETEKHDGYFRDRCVFSEQIDIEDTMNLLIDYQNGVKMTYSLNAFMPWEGLTVNFNGTRGRIEHQVVQEPRVFDNGQPTMAFNERAVGQMKTPGISTVVYPHFGRVYAVDPWLGSTGKTHGGADELMLYDLFASQPPYQDKYQRKADHRAAAYSILIGIAADRSMDIDRQIAINELVHDLAMPDFPPMPTDEESLTFESVTEVQPMRPGWI